MRCCQDLRSDIRKILVAGMPALLELSTRRQKLLEELRELIDDEEPGVKFEALSVLPDCLGHCTPEQIENSGIVKEVAGIFLSACDLAVSPEMQSILVQQSVKVLHKVTDEALLNAVLKFFAVCISTQEK